MTDEQINAAIAEACGWTKVNAKHRSGRALYADYVGNEFILNYCNDLNAMHEAEKVLTEHQNESIYPRNLGAWKNPTKPIYATARQRAEAFLLTLGKWSATNKESLTVAATTEESSAVQSTSSGGSGGASTYGGKGLGIAGAGWPPETRITVNGKTFCLADIDKEMTE